MQTVIGGLSLLFVAGYVLIALEHFLRVNKSASALLTGVFCWGLLFLVFPQHRQELMGELSAHLADIAGIVFFVLCAMAIVQIIQVHRGVLFVARWLSRYQRASLIGVVVLLTFLLSAVIDNLTTALVMVALLRGLIPEQAQLRKLVAGLIVIAANAGGAWSPIGDVTTTMLWIGGHIHAGAIVRELFLPAFVSAMVPLLVLLPWLRFELPALAPSFLAPEPYAGLVFSLGIAGLLSVPVFHTVTGLPPVFGAFLAVGVLWIVTELLHRRSPDHSHLRVHVALQRVDVSTVLFFVGILLAVDALQTGHVLAHVAQWLDQLLPRREMAVTFFGIDLCGG